MWSNKLLPALLLSALPVSVLGGDILSTTGFSQCMNNPSIKVNTMNVRYDKNTRQLTFDVAGTSNKVQKVTADMIVTAYGQQVYSKTFNPCDTGMKEMCPVPDSSFKSQGDFPIPEQYASQIPALAFSIPDLDGNVKLQLKDADGQDVGCVQSTIGNGNTLNIPAISYVAAGMAAAALLVSGAAAAAAGGHPGASTSSPTFGEIIGHFQGMAVNGMLSVQYPDVYRSFTSNFAFSTGLISWGGLQKTIDSFRKSTGGNLTEDNYPYLKNQATLVYDDGQNSSASASSSPLRRAIDTAMIFARDGVSASGGGESTSFGNGGGGNGNGNGGAGSEKNQHFVGGIEAYAEQLTIPQANTFMTVLLIWAIVVAAIIVGVLLIKAILEAWSLFGKLPKSLESFRKRYWWRMAKAITNLILLLYGVWTLYCIYQFTNGDSWAAKVLAGVTLALFTAVLAWFTWRIYTKAQQFKKMDGDTSQLYEDKETWIKYSLFYDNYSRNWWIFFVPAIVYMFARGCIIAGANGKGLIQAGGQLIVEAIMLILLLWARPYQRTSGKWINIVIQFVRVLSVCCILVFVEELGISQTTKTITGVVLIVVQSVLTVVLAILIAVNALITFFKKNPHVQQRKEAEKANLTRDLDNLTPLDARNSLLMEPMAQNTAYKGGIVTSATFRDDKKGVYDPVPPRPASPNSFYRPTRYDDQSQLMNSAASMGSRDRSMSHGTEHSRFRETRQPTLPDLR